MDQSEWLLWEPDPDSVSGEATWLLWVTTTEVLHYGLGITDMVRHGKAEQMRVAAIMKRLGYTQRQCGPTRQRRWVKEVATPNNLTHPEQPRVNNL